MKKKVLIILLFALVLSVDLLIGGCSNPKDECPIMRALKNGQVQITSADNYHIGRIIYAIKGDRLVVANGDFQNLVMNDKAYALDVVEKTYEEIDPNKLGSIHAIWVKYDKMKFLEKTQDGEYTNYDYLFGNYDFTFIYKSDTLCFVNVRIYDNPLPDVSGVIIDKLPVESFSDTVSDELLFEIPEDYKLVEP
jgi:hypothetical protein